MTYPCNLAALPLTGASLFAQRARSCETPRNRRPTPGRRIMATTPGRRFSPLTQDQRYECQRARHGMVLPHRRRRHQGHAARGQWHPVLHRARSRVGGGRAHGAASSGTSPWKSKGGWHIGNRGVGMYGNWLYFWTPDCQSVSLNLKNGTERWRKTICDLDQFYYGSMAPLVVKNHIIAGVSGDDLDRPGYLSALRPGDRRPAVALVRRPAEEGRARARRPGPTKRR